MQTKTRNTHRILGNISACMRLTAEKVKEQERFDRTDRTYWACEGCGATTRSGLCSDCYTLVVEAVEAYAKSHKATAK